jgi:hypothetical protein
MNNTAYWYFIDGHLGQHISPPVDPSSTTFITVQSEDVGYRQVRVELTPCIEGRYLQPIMFTSESHETPKNFRDRIEKYIKQTLREQRHITDWTTKERKIKKSKNKKLTKRCKCKND